MTAATRPAQNFRRLLPSEGKMPNARAWGFQARAYTVLVAGAGFEPTTFGL